MLARSWIKHIAKHSYHRTDRLNECMVRSADQLQCCWVIIIIAVRHHQSVLHSHSVQHVCGRLNKPHHSTKVTLGSTETDSFSD